MAADALPPAEWRATFIRFCPVCNVETMPLSSGICGFCETLIAEPTLATPDDFHGLCVACGTPFDGTARGWNRKYCSDNCRRETFENTPAGAAWRTEKARRRRIADEAERVAYKELTNRLEVARDWRRWRPHHRELLAAEGLAA